MKPPKQLELDLDDPRTPGESSQDPRIIPLAKELREYEQQLKMRDATSGRARPERPKRGGPWYM